MNIKFILIVASTKILFLQSKYLSNFFKFIKVVKYFRQLPRRLYTCKLCPSKFTNPSSLREHVENDEHRLPCHICQAVFTCERYLRKHLLLQHKKQDEIS